MKKATRLTPHQVKELGDFISITSDSVESRHAQTILMLDQGVSLSLISKFTQYKRRQIFKLRAQYLAGGIEKIVNKRKPHPKLILTKAQREEVLQTIRTKTPHEIGYAGERFWKTSLLSYWIKKQFGVQYKSKTSYYVLFKQTKFSFHKPGKVYEKRDEEKVKVWKQSMRPTIEACMKDDNIVLLAEDEMILSSQTTFQKIWLKQGEYPKIEVSNTKINKSIYGFLNIKTGKEHAFEVEKQNMHITKECLKKIREAYPDKQIEILWDGAGWHRGSVVTDFIKEDSKINRHYFPPYSPEENPQEHVWKSARQKITHNRFIEDINIAAKDFIHYLNNENFNYKLLGFSAL